MAKRNIKIPALSGGAVSRATAQLAVDNRKYKILSAKIKDDYCHYGYEVTEGVGIGDVHPGVKGCNVIKDELRTSLQAMRVHLATIADIFKFREIVIDDIDKFHSHDITQLFTVTGFNIKGDEDAESIQLIGNYYVSSGARMDLETHFIPMDNLSSYTWHNELKAAADDARNEVALYKEGYYTPVKNEEDEEDAKVTQMKITHVDDFDNE